MFLTACTANLVQLKNTSLQRQSYSKQRNQNSDIYITEYILQNYHNAQL